MKRRKKVLALLLAVDLLAGTMAAGGAAMADGASTPGTPYNAQGGYDATVPHVLINQVYGGGDKDDALVSNGFIELYNPTDSAIGLGDWSLQIADVEDADTGESGGWTLYPLSGEIKAHSSYLIVGKQSASEDLSLDISDPEDYDLAIDREINNNGIKVVLMSNQTTTLADANPFAASPKPDGYVDMLGSGSNDNGSMVDGYETDYPTGKTGGMSKKLSVRRSSLTDTDNNKADFQQISYEDIEADTLERVRPRSGHDAPWGQALGISTDALPGAHVGAAYSAATAVYGGSAPFTYAADGLPEGLTIDGETGVISGTPDAGAEGGYTVHVSVADSSVPTPMTAERDLPLNVLQANEPPIADTLTVEAKGVYKVGQVNADGGVAEIVKYNKDNGRFYLVNGSATPPTLDIASLGNAEGTLQKVGSVNIEPLVDSDEFAYGDLTSVDINTATKRIAVAVQEADATKNGKILVLDYDGKLLKSYEAGVQPDMIKYTADGRYILTADEGEPRDGVDPDGSVTIVDTTTDAVTHVKFDDPSVIADNVHIRGASNEDEQVVGEGAKEDAKFDMEPEYIALSADETKAYVSLQENNAIGTIDIAAKKVLSVKGLGLKDLNDPRNALDVVKDGKINLENVPFYGMYMPDGIAAYTLNSTPYLFTANEGDVTEWPGRNTSDKLKDIKDGLDPESAAAKFLQVHADGSGKTPYDSIEVATDMGNESVYLFGARSFSIWNADTMAQVYDSGNDFEKITAERLPEHFNASNDDTDLDSRSQKKGPEPEYVAVGKVGSKVYAFVGLERIGGIMTYDVTDPAHPAFANYINTRDWSLTGDDALETDSGPEGLDFIPAEISPTARPLLLVANEVGGTVRVLQLDVAPSSGDDDGTYTPPAGGNNAPGNEDNDSGALPGQAVLDDSALHVSSGTDANGRAVDTVTVDADALTAAFADAHDTAAGGHAQVLVRLPQITGAAVVTLPENALSPDSADLVIGTGAGSYELPLKSLFDLYGSSIAGGLQVTIAPVEGTSLNAMQSGAGSFGAAIVSGPLETKVTAVIDGQEQELENFGSTYISRTLFLTDSGDHLTGALYDPQTGAFSFVPGTPTTLDGKPAFKLSRPGNSLYTVLHYSKDFADMTGHWAEADVEQMASKLIVEGVDDTHFAPSQKVTRAEFTAMLVRSLGLNPAADGAAGFTDVPADAWYAGAVGAAAQAGLANGTETGGFAPNAPITRAEMAVMVARAIQFAGGSLTAAGAAALDSFADRAAIPQWAAEQAALLASGGIMEGDPQGHFGPADNATRAQAAVILLRALQSIHFVE